MISTTEQKTDEQKSEFKQFDTSRIPESEYQKYGIKPENVEGELKAMSYGYKSPFFRSIYFRQEINNNQMFLQQ